MKKISLLHPFLFTFASILYSYSSSITIVSPEQMLRPLIVMWVIVVLLIYPFYSITRKWSSTGILLTIFVFAFFSVRTYFYRVFPFVLLIVVSWIIILFLLKRKASERQINVLLNLLAIFIIGIYINKVYGYFSPIILNGGWDIRASFNIDRKNIQTTTKPDIYFIIFDAYGRADILSKYYDYDNSRFIEQLRSMGFIVPENSHSNYIKTVLSDASVLNMNYIQAIMPDNYQDSFFGWLMSPLIDHSLVREFLEQSGYQTVSLVSDWSITDNTTTDLHLNPYRLNMNDLEGYLLISSPLGLFRSIARKLSYVPSFDTHREIVEYNFDKLTELSTYTGPKFVFAHIVTPHPPFVFDADGKPVTPDYTYSFLDASDFPGTADQYREGYVTQLQYVNQRILQMVKNILENSETPPIIIMQGDHGPGMLTDFNSAENSCLQERFSIFAAYYLPGLKSDPIPDDISSVNVFRVILNKYFAIDLPLLDNSFYFSQDIHIYNLQDVTSHLQDVCLPGTSQ